MNRPENDLRWAYYHIANTNKKALYKISSCFPITDKYVEHEYTSNNKHVILQRTSDIEIIKKKLKKILSFENRRNNYFRTLLNYNINCVDTHSYIVISENLRTLEDAQRILKGYRTIRFEYMDLDRNEDLTLVMERLSFTEKTLVLVHISDSKFENRKSAHLLDSLLNKIHKDQINNNNR